MSEHDARPEHLADALERLNRSNLALHNALSELIGMSPTDFAALAHLSGDGPMTQETLRRRLRLKKSSMTALVDRLERSGHAERTPHPTDRRATLLVASEEARQGREYGARALGESLAAAADRHSPAERAAILAFLEEAARIQEEGALRLSTDAAASPPADPRPPRGTAGGL